MVMRRGEGEGIRVRKGRYTHRSVSTRESPVSPIKKAETTMHVQRSNDTELAIPTKQRDFLTYPEHS
jgi:hypothetical protein